MPKAQLPAEIVRDWMRRDEVMEKCELGSLAAITRLQKAGKLKPTVVEGVNYYDPDEVEVVRAEREAERSKLETPEGRKAAWQEYQLDTVKQVINLIGIPREKIDDLQFRIIERQEARIIALEKELDSERKAKIAAEDASADRVLAGKQLDSENRIREVATNRVIDTASKLVMSWMSGGAPKGLQLNPEQIKQLLDANNDGEEKFLTAEQVKVAEAELAKAGGKANGKAVVEGAVATVKQVVEAQAAS